VTEQLIAPVIPPTAGPGLARPGRAGGGRPLLLAGLLAGPAGAAYGMSRIDASGWLTSCAAPACQSRHVRTHHRKNSAMAPGTVGRRRPDPAVHAAKSSPPAAASLQISARGPGPGRRTGHDRRLTAGAACPGGPRPEILGS
jgi:hypothetical protein